MDKETSKIITEGDKWNRFVKGEEWGMVKARLLDRLINLSDLTLIDEGQDPVIALLNIKAKKLAITELKGVIDEIEGEAHQSSFNKTAFEDMRRTEIISRYDA